MLARVHCDLKKWKVKSVDMLNPRNKMPVYLDQNLMGRIPEELRRPFETKLADFQQRRLDLLQLVRDGEMTVRAARARAQELAGELKQVVESSVGQARAKRAPISVRLQEAQSSRKKAKSAEAVQQETVRLLERNLVELQIVNRKQEFEQRTYVRNATSTVPAPSFERMFDFLQESQVKNDPAAVEWVRRQLEQMRPIAPPELADRLDVACDRPGSINPRLIAKYQAAIADHLAEPGLLEAFLDQAVADTDANACAAVFEMARLQPAAISAEAQLKLAAVLEQFPEQALAYARQVESQVARQDAELIGQFEQMSLEYLAQQASFEEVRQPTETEIQQRARVAELERREPDQPIGLRVGGSDYDPQSHLI